MGTITLNNGMQITGKMLESNGRLFLYLDNITMTDAFTALIDPENTKTIKMARDGKITTVKGYKHLYAIEETNGRISAAIQK